jgi:hypothetical protein
MVCSSNGEDTALSRQRCEFDSRTDYKDYTLEGGRVVKGGRL